MDVETRIKVVIGELVMNLQIANAKIEELTAKVEQLEAAKPEPKLKSVQS